VGGWVGGVGKIVIPMPEALSFAESRRQKHYTYLFLDGVSPLINGTTPWESINSTLMFGNTTLNPGPPKKKIFICPEGQVEITRDKCYLHTYDTPVKKARGICEVILIVWSILYLAICARELTFLPLKIFLQNMALCPSRVLFLIGCVLMLLTIPLRLSCEDVLENNVAILVMLFLGFYFLFFCR
jgi:hypothetical protein